MIKSSIGTLCLQGERGRTYHRQTRSIMNHLRRYLNHSSSTSVRIRFKCKWTSSHHRKKAPNKYRLRRKICSKSRTRTSRRKISRYLTLFKDNKKDSLSYSRTKTTIFLYNVGSMNSDVSEKRTKLIYSISKGQ
jgi:hypothetical protein